MFGRRRRRSGLTLEQQFASFFETSQIVAVDAADVALGDCLIDLESGVIVNAEVPRVADVDAHCDLDLHADLGAESDARFFEMIALLDTSLADLLSTCDRIERDVAAAYLAG